MSYFKLKLFLLLLALVLTASASAILLFNGRISLGILISLALPIEIVMVFHICGLLIGTLSSFVGGLEMNDTSMRFEAKGADRELKEMADGMNKITMLYHQANKDLETRKLYYDRILRVMTHEMRNAITPVVSLSAGITADVDSYSREEIVEALEVIRTQSESITRFLDSYHALTHLPRPEKKHVNAIQFFRKLHKSLQQFETTGKFDANCISYKIADHATLYIDEALFSQALTNILKNSLEAVAQKQRPTITVIATMSAHSCKINISDNGNGLPPSIASDPFQPFITTKPDGNGIGLFLSRQIVMLHEGNILLDNYPAKGLSITITIPTR